MSFSPRADMRSLFASIWPFDRSWFLFVPYGSIIWLLIYWCWNPLATFRRKSPKVWFDKFSVIQNDYTDNVNTLLRLPLYLKHTKELLCVFDQDYVSRLWCIFELSVYLKVRQDPVTIFVNTSQKVMEFVIISWKTITFVIVVALKRSSVKQQTRGFLWIWFLNDMAVVIFTFILGQQWFLDNIKLRDTIKTYDVRKATLSSPDDRLLLLRLKWKKVDKTHQNRIKIVDFRVKFIQKFIRIMKCFVSRNNSKNRFRYIDYYWGTAKSEGQEAVNGLNAFNDHIRKRVHRVEEKLTNKILSFASNSVHN